ncbi:Adenine deaminase [bioreactor metagenome]|uniref:adenine deaminase n=1 Tax=bioreactor metagenome TaxID=1076179 RepID=A0A644YEL3_9ZZZZ|nr:adenine deaminase [Candidatus Metalachnospira sp.]
MRTLKETEELIACGLGEIPCDWKFENVKLVDVFSEEVIDTDIYIKGKRIVSIDPNAEIKAVNVKNCKGKYAIPGLIDAHMHFESTMLSPEALASVVVPCGTTTMLADLMEIANVAGEEGLKEMLKSIETLPYRMLIEVSSRVPTAPGLETTGAVLGEKEVDELLEWDKSISLGEMDSSKILITREKQYLEKILSALKRGKVVNGHAIGRLGQELNVYAASGISDDHECVTVQEMKERLRVGVKVFIREGSTERNVDALVKGIVENNIPTDNIMFCTDDKHIDDIKTEGHINYNVNRAIELGLSPMKAIKIATIHTAKHFRAEEEIGSLTPGRFADIIISDSMEKIVPKEVWFEGRLVARDGELIERNEVRKYPDWIKDTVHLKKPVTAERFEVTCTDEQIKDGYVFARIIDLIENQIVNNELVDKLPVIDNKVICDLNKDYLKLAVVERYGKTGGIGVGFVRGFKLKKGAMAYSMSHDHHNIVVVGTNDYDMALAANCIAEIKGGLCTAEDGKIIAVMSLPIGGLMSEKSSAEVAEELKIMNESARKIGCEMSAPFMALSFISLPTVPKLGLTDKGLIDVLNHKLIPVIV